MTLLTVKQKRIWEIDFLRGLAIILMIFDHIMWDLYLIRAWFCGTPNLNGNDFLLSLHRTAYAYLKSDIQFWGHMLFSNLFVFLVGVSTALSHSNIKRGIRLLAVSVGLTLVTYLLSMFIEFSPIIFGILHCLSISLLIYSFINQLTKNKWVYLVLAIPIIALGIHWKFWDVTFADNFEFSELGSIIIGYGSAFGEDYFPLFPYLGVLFLGVFFGMTVYKNRTSVLPKLDGKWNKPVCFIGRHALVIYLAHQIIIPVIIFAIAYSMGCRF